MTAHIVQNGNVVATSLPVPGERAYAVKADDRRHFVFAASEDEALAIVRALGIEAQSAGLMQPWLGVGALKPDPSDNLQPVEHGSRQADGSIGASHPRTAEVVAWVKSYTGRNEFVQDVKFKMENPQKWHGQGPSKKPVKYRLSHKQVDALAKVKDREGARKQPGPGVSGLNLWAVLPYGTTYAAAENERGTLSFVRMDKVERGKWADFVFVKAYIGGDSSMRLGMQGPDSDEYRGQWAQVLRNVAADVPGAVARFGQELGICGVCNTPLTNEESRRLGIGPVCRSKLGA